MERRDFLRAAGGTTGTLLLAGNATGQEESYPQPVDGAEAYQSKITTIRYPLAGVPAILEAGDELRIEIDTSGTLPAGVDAADLESLSAYLEPSFGGTDVQYDLSLEENPPSPSTIWPGETFAVLEADVPEVTKTAKSAGKSPQKLTPDLYDLHVTWDGGEDHQPRAVRVYHSFPDDPKIAVIADPQIGDPRALQSGAEEAQNKQTPQPIVTRTQRTVGDGSADSRWNATQTAIDEVNLLDPDIVLIAGDLTFGQDAPGKWYAEYEEAWRVVNDIQAPTFTVLGNHDGYIQSGVDGKELYRETFAPWYYSVDVGDDLHITALDTYDWNVLDRQGASFAVSTYGGQVRDTQWEWLQNDITENEDRTILAFGHHNPSWQWDGDYQPADQTRGTPGAEQLGRGTRFFTTGQAWTGQRHRFDIRDLFDEAGVSAYFSGHTHRDRIARTVPKNDGPADVVETPGPNTANDGQYHYIEYEDRDGDGHPEGQRNDGNRSQDDLAGILNDGEGTLYVNCTTSGSSTGEYWGWRPLSVDTANGDLTINNDEFGYPATDEFLDDRAVNPGSWNSDHSEVGLYSHPSYLIEVKQVESTAERAKADIYNGLATPFSGAVVLSIGDCNGIVVDGGTKVWERSDGKTTDVKVRFDGIQSGDRRTVAVQCKSN